MPKTSRLTSYMGHRGDHNANCMTPEPGLQVGQTYRVMARLAGTTYSIYLDGKEACTVGGFSMKYGATTGVKLWMGDKFNLPANAMVANLVYKALGDPKQL